MKRLLLLRHAKSDWSDAGLGDFDRPLAPRGRKAAPRMGRYLESKGPIPDLVLCSAARRARETWDLVAAELKSKPDARFLKGLYAAAPSALLRAVHRAPGDCACLMVIAHNPGMETLARRLAGTGGAKAIERLDRGFPTGALADLRFDADTWAAIAEGEGDLRRLMRPRDLA